jgi:hypothetical protein
MADRLAAYKVTEQGVEHPFRDTVVPNLVKLVDVLPKLNITNDSELERLAEFFASDPTRAFYGTTLFSALEEQVPFDGVQSTISLFDAGIWTEADTKKPTFPLFKITPVCAEIKQSQSIMTIAMSQTHRDGEPLGTPHDVYINTGRDALKQLTQATVLHETLHNDTGLNDPQLEIFLGLTPTTGATDVINKVLEDNGCVGKN